MKIEINFDHASREFSCGTSPRLFHANQEGEFVKDEDNKVIPLLNGQDADCEQAIFNLLDNAWTACSQGFLTYAAGARKPIIAHENESFVDKNPVDHYLTKPETTSTQWSSMTEEELDAILS